ncbi:MAG: hypothetical protein RI907_561 [Pseudomonadota bacterium]|jgi:hypothetical protein
MLRSSASPAAAPSRAPSTLASRRRLWRLALATSLGLGLAACASWMGPRTIEVSREDLLGKLNQKFPIQKQVLGYLNVTVSHPQLTMRPDANRVSTTVALLLDDTMFHKLHDGHVTGSFSLRYEPRDLTIRLDQVRLDELAMPTLSPFFLDSLQRLGNQFAQDVLQGYVVKQLKPEDLRRADRLGYEVQGLRVTATGLAVDLVPKQAAAASAPR